MRCEVQAASLAGSAKQHATHATTAPIMPSGDRILSARIKWVPLLGASCALTGYAVFHHFNAPLTGHVLDFKVTEASDGGPAHGSFLGVEVSPDTGTLDDFAATAVAIASVVPADTVIVSIERNDVASSVDRWRRVLARAEYRPKEETSWTVSTANPLLSANEIAASDEYSSREGLALTNEGEPLSPEADIALVKEIASKHGLPTDRVTMFTPLHKEIGDRTDWSTLSGPGSQHVRDLASCYAGKTRGTDEWESCR